MTKYIKIGDIAVVILAISAIIFYIDFRKDNKSNVIIIETPHNKYRYLSIDNRVVVVDGLLGESRIEINNNTAHFLSSLCRDKICVKAGNLEYTPIVCLPNGISIYYENLKTDNGDDIDSFVQ